MTVVPNPDTDQSPNKDAAMASGLALFFIGFSVFCYFCLPLFIEALGPVWGVFLILLVLGQPTFWAVLHEAIHGHLDTDKGRNRTIGRLLALTFGSPYRSLQFSHMMHHRWSRSSFDRPDVYDPARQSWARASLIYYPRLVLGLYGAEVLTNVLTLMPKAWSRPIVAAMFSADGDLRPVIDAQVDRGLYGTRALKELRTDSIAILILFGVSLWLFGSNWWMLVLAMLARGIIQSVTDNAPHYATPLNDADWSLNMSLPLGLSRVVLNFNMHRSHHEAMAAPWYQLPERTVWSANTDIPFWQAIGRQFLGPVAITELDDRGKVAL